MPQINFSTHAREMLKERDILEEWVSLAINSPDNSEKHTKDGNWHYTKSIAERENRVLHVVVNQDAAPYRVVTVFFDRRLRRRR